MKIEKKIGLIATLLFSCFLANVAFARIIFQDDLFSEIESEGILLDSSSNNGNVVFQMGNDGTDGWISWDNLLNKFSFNNNVDINGSLTTTGNLTTLGNVNFSAALQTRVREVVGFNAGPSGTSCLDNGELAVDKNNSDLYICVNAATDTWEWINVGGGGGSLNLDQAYNNFGAGASTVVVDAAQGQTGGLLFQGSLTANPTMRITNSANGGGLQVENNGTGNTFSAWDSFGDTTPFTVNNAGRVGIGQANPQNPLDIEEASDVIEIGNNTASNICIVFDDDGAVDRKFCWDDVAAAFTTGGVPLIAPTNRSATPGSCDSTTAGLQWQDTDNGNVYVCDVSNSRFKWLSVTDKQLWGEGLNSSCGGNTTSLLSAPNCGAKMGASVGYTNTNNGFYIPENITITGVGISVNQNFYQSGCTVDLTMAHTTNPFNFTSTGIEVTMSSWNVSSPSDLFTAYNNLNIDVPGGRYIVFGPEPKNCQVMQSFIMTVQYRTRGS